MSNGEPAELIRWLASLGPEVRDAAMESRLGIRVDVPSAPPGEDLVGYHASGVAPILRMLLDVPVVQDDVLVDLGAGLGKVVLLAHLLTGARTRGIEIQPSLAAAAQRAAGGLDVVITEEDVRSADIDDGTVFFLYAPFTGAVLKRVVTRLEAVAARRAIVVVTLGIDLGVASWLVPRPTDAFWLTIHDSKMTGVRPRRARASAIATDAAWAIALELAWHGRIARSSSSMDASPSPAGSGSATPGSATAAVSSAQQAFAEKCQESGGALLPASDVPKAEPSGPALAGFVSSTISTVLTRA